MLCEDYEVFLEMGHVLKGLEVSILKGVLEHRSGKLWACVVVEVHQRLPPLFSTHCGFWSGASKINYTSEYVFIRILFGCVLPRLSQALGGFSQTQILYPLMHLVHRWS